MKRSVVKQGPSTLMVSLPSQWVKKLNLQKGDEVDVELAANDLIISKEPKSKKKQTEVDLTSHTESSIRTAVINAYRSGDIIKINFKDEQQYQIIKDILKNYVIGFDVIKKEKDFCIVENITEPSTDQFDVLFRKILYNISLLIRSTKERLEKETDFKDYQDVVLKIHQYDNFCRRVITKKNLFGSKSHLFWTFLTLLVHGQRELYYLNKFLDKEHVDFKNLKYYENLEKVFELLKTGYIKNDLKKLEKIHDLEKTIIYKEFYNLIQKNQKENVILFHITNSIKRFYLASSPLAGLLLSSNTSK